MPSSDIISSSEKLAKQKLTIAFAESATAGRLAAEFSLTPFAGEVLCGGIVCYNVCIKKDVLGVSDELINKYTPESAEVTEALAVQLSQIMPADIHIAVTGLTKPGGSETPEKPVGSMFIHIRHKARDYRDYNVFDGSPESIVLQTANRVAQLLLDII
ncbi:CinA family protein [Pedobacter sp. BS3]|uniref:CinA family protein n=1 Tax=Pedobacter sp. BS3 TaxID=2567937 RepID=UPI0011F004FD|nr:CinA family protein [Pedobacter sp. BS3]TZF83690.1 CinA family protein [Pedobacter sp. BS3]